MATETRGLSSLYQARGKKESEKDERINLRVIFPTIIAFFVETMVLISVPMLILII